MATVIHQVFFSFSFPNVQRPFIFVQMLLFHLSMFFFFPVMMQFVLFSSLSIPQSPEWRGLFDINIEFVC